MTIEIVSDEDWLTLTGGGPRSLLLTKQRAAVIKALADGPAVSDNGMATQLLRDRMRAHGYTALNQSSLNAMLREPSMLPALNRDVRGRRTYRIELTALPERWAHVARSLNADPP